MSTIKDRLMAVIGACDGMQSRAARLMGMTPSAVRWVESGKRAPSKYFVRQLEAAEAVIAQKGFDAAVEFPRVASKAKLPAPDAHRSRTIPVVSWAACGLAQDFEGLRHQLEEVMETQCKAVNAFGLIAEGDSMRPLVQPGDRVIIDPDATARSGDLALVRLATGEILLKTIQFSGRNGENLTLESANSDYETITIKRDRVATIAPAVELKRSLRK